jgi:hypothetical protein
MGPVPNLAFISVATTSSMLLPARFLGLKQRLDVLRLNEANSEDLSRFQRAIRNPALDRAAGDADCAHEFVYAVSEPFDCH